MFKSLQLPAIACALVALSSAAAQSDEYTKIDNHPCLRDYNGITKSMFDLADANPTLATVTDIGDTYLKLHPGSAITEISDIPEDGFDIWGFNVTNSDSSHTSDEKAKVLIISGVHSREYATSELNMRFAEKLLDGFGDNSDINWILNHTEVHFIFTANPDGRYMAESDVELWWRKNANFENGSTCDHPEDNPGVDMNRNYPFAWGREDGASADPCMDDFFGSAPGSEPEVQAVIAYAKSIFPEHQFLDDPENSIDMERGENTTGVFIDIHSSGRMIYYPWGFVDQIAPDDDALQAFGRKLAKADDPSRDHVLWAPEQPDFMYPASGDATDYMYGALGVASFGFEIGQNFDEDCPVFEDEVVADNIPALMYAVKAASLPLFYSQGPDILSLSVHVDEEYEESSNEIHISVKASDSELVNIENYPTFHTGDQAVNGVTLFLDVHPENHNGAGHTWELAFVDTKDGIDTFGKVVRMPSDVSPGRHIIYAQAVDSDGYLGPVTSSWIDVPEITNPNQLLDGDGMINPCEVTIGRSTNSPLMVDCDKIGKQEEPRKEIKPLIEEIDNGTRSKALSLASLAATAIVGLVL